ncbi:hypothetical protein D3C73_745740 [compost metagenome]
MRPSTSVTVTVPAPKVLTKARRDFGSNTTFRAPAPTGVSATTEPSEPFSTTRLSVPWAATKMRSVCGSCETPITLRAPGTRKTFSTVSAAASMTATSLVELEATYRRRASRS